MRTWTQASKAGQLVLAVQRCREHGLHPFLATSRVIEKPAPVADAPAPVGTCHGLGFRACSSVLGGSPAGCGLSTSISISLHSKLPPSRSLQLRRVHVCSFTLQLLMHKPEILCFHNPADTHFELYVLFMPNKWYMVKFSLISSWDPDLIITVLFTLIIIYWFDKKLQPWHTEVSQYSLYCGNARCWWRRRQTCPRMITLRLRGHSHCFLTLSKF